MNTTRAIFFMPFVPSVLGARGSKGIVPDVEGLECTPMGCSSEYQSINGKITGSRSLTYLVTPTCAGTLTTRPLKEGGGRVRVSAASGVLRVTGSGSTPTVPNPPGADATKKSAPNVVVNAMAWFGLAALSLSLSRRQKLARHLHPTKTSKADHANRDPLSHGKRSRLGPLLLDAAAVIILTAAMLALFMRWLETQHAIIMM